MIYLTRFKTSDDGTFGTLGDDTNVKLCYTAEPPLTGDHPAIPEGVYDVSPYKSPIHGSVWQVKVPDRANIEIHPGNTHLDSLGCILVGNAMGKVNGLPAVMNSQDTFAMLQGQLPRYFQLTVKNNF